MNALYPCLGTALVLYAGLARAPDGACVATVSRVLSLPPLVWTGLISYSLYLIHWPIAVFARYATLREPDVGEAIAMTGLSFLLAALSWKFVEQPVRHSARRISRGKMFAFGLGLLALLFAAGAAMVLRKGFPMRHPDFVEQQIPIGAPWKVGTCFNGGSDPLERWTLADCTRVTGQPRRIMLWGDSFAAQHVEGVIANAGLIGADLIQRTYAGCPPDLSYFSYARRSCTAFNAASLELAVRLRVDAVVLAAKWSDAERHGLAGLQQTVDRLRAAGIPVYVIGQTPFFAMDIQKVAFLSGAGLFETASASPGFDPALNARVRRHVRGAVFIDPLRSMCSGKACVYRDGPTYLYSDYGHYSQEGSRRAVKAYFPRF